MLLDLWFRLSGGYRMYRLGYMRGRERGQETAMLMYRQGVADGRRLERTARGDVANRLEYGGLKVLDGGE